MSGVQSARRHWFLPLVCAVLGGLAAGGCDATLGEGQFLCDPDVPGSCPTGWICQNRGTTGQWRCYSSEGAYCGNGIMDADEQCDGTDFGEVTCLDLQERPGLIVCREDCLIHCTVCGNGQLEMIDELNREECDDGNNLDDDDCSAECMLEKCGDGIVQEAVEVCDDGTKLDGDGCSANCLSDESCGNGILDLVTGEQCDDGNWGSNDGCSSDCAYELESWNLWRSRFDDGRGGHKMVFDSDRHRIVLFGGRTPSGIANQTWEYDGLQWTESTGSPRPPARQYHAMAYDSVRMRTVMFGGVNSVGAFLDDTWEYDGTNWQQINTPTPPGSRRNHALTFDPQRGRVVLFGGQAASDLWLNDTWEYDGVSWVETTPAGAVPFNDDGQNLVYDTAHNRVLFVGNGTGTELEVWAYDGSSWTPLSVGAQAPVKRFNPSISFDSDRGVLVLHGGDRGHTLLLNDTWEFDGSLWTQPATPSAPPSRIRGAMAYYPPAGHMVLHGGFSTTEVFADTWQYDATAPPGGVRWTIQNFTATPSARELHVMAYDRRREVTVVWGGQSGGAYIAPTTWEFNGLHWSQNTGVTQWPSPRSGATMVYDQQREVMVLFGGRDLVSEVFPADHTWEYDGVDWTPVDTPTVPDARMAHGMAYDAAEGLVVLYGGNSSSTNFLGDTWVYDGSDWIQRSPPNPPSDRGFHQMVYSPVLRRIVLFGGIHLFDRFTDTWLYDTAQDSWIQLPTPTSPPLRVAFGMAWNTTRHKVMIYGGFDFFASLHDTWELDGFSWRQRNPVSVPSDHRLPVMVYDVARRQPTVFGGFTDETWLYRFGVPSAEQCDNGEDDDGDNLADCEDPDCALIAGCPSLDTICVNTDGSTRCEDPRCGGYPCRADGSGPHLAKVCMAGLCACPNLGFEADCTNGQDDNCDGLVDCQDTNTCGGHPMCEPQETTCADSFDNDGDGLVDCADDDCIVFSWCESPTEQSCTDGFDNDGDGAIDCLDGDCIFSPHCPIEPIW